MTTITVTITETSTKTYTVSQEQAIELLDGVAPTEETLVEALKALDSDDLAASLEETTSDGGVEFAVTERDAEVESDEDQGSGQ